MLHPVVAWITKTRIKSRVALNAYADTTETTRAGADIPAGVQLIFPYEGKLRAYNDGTLTGIRGYYDPSTGQPVWRSCYVHTNWQSGSISSYYVQLF